MNAIAKGWTALEYIFYCLSFFPNSHNNGSSNNDNDCDVGDEGDDSTCCHRSTRNSQEMHRKSRRHMDRQNNRTSKDRHLTIKPNLLVKGIDDRAKIH